MIERRPTRVLDVGCGAGLLGKQLRSLYPECVCVGVEPDPQRAALASEHFEEVLLAPVDSIHALDRLEMLPQFDLIICADVLEHLVDPAATLRRLASILAPGGSIITSLPNVRHLSTFVDLYLRGRWPQRERGIHDKTHLHYFARPNIIELGEGAGLVHVVERRNLRLFEAHSWSMIPAKILDFWPLRGVYTFQYLHRWVRRG